VRQPAALFTDVSNKHRSFSLFSSIQDDDDDGEPQSNNGRVSSIGGNFFEEVPTATNQNREDQNQLSIQDMEMLATPFDEHLPKINVVTLVGRVGNDPEPRYFDDGKVVLNLSLAVKRKYHPLERKVRGIRSGEEETDWFPLEFWGRDAEYVASYVEKGARLGITGSLVGSEWVDRMTGEQRRRPKILVRHIDILESRAEAELRKGQKGSGQYSGGVNRDGAKYGDDDDGPSSGSSGGFFDT
jgi:single-strand DNA-binding protein